MEALDMSRTAKLWFRGLKSFARQFVLVWTIFTMVAPCSAWAYYPDPPLPNPDEDEPGPCEPEDDSCETCEEPPLPSPPGPPKFPLLKGHMKASKNVPGAGKSDHPVLLAQGFVIESEVDLQLSGPAIPWKFIRTYSSNSNIIGGVTQQGAGWLNNIEDVQLVQHGQHITVSLPEATGKATTRQYAPALHLSQQGCNNGRNGLAGLALSPTQTTICQNGPAVS
jgi:hypothetical protein